MRINVKRWLCLALMLTLALCLSACARKDAATAYSGAQQLLADGNYSAAASAFAALGGYEEASRLSMYAQAHAEAAAGNYALAAASMAALGDFRDAPLQATYYQAQGLLAAAPEATDLYDDAEKLLAGLGVFRQSHLISVDEAAYQDGLRLVEESRFDLAMDVFGYLSYDGYKDSDSQYMYALARSNEAAGQSVQAANGFLALGNFRDSAARLAACTDAAWAALMAQVEAGEIADAQAAVRQMLYNSAAFAAYAELPQLETYLQARALEQDGGADIDSYSRAASLYAGLGDYRDSAQRAQFIPQSIYNNALAALEEGDFDTAETLFAHQSGYEDSLVMVDYTRACRLQADAGAKLSYLRERVENGKATWNDVGSLWQACVSASDAFTALGETRDSARRAADSLNILYDYAMELGAQGEYILAANILSVAAEQEAWQAQGTYFTAQYYLQENETKNDPSLVRRAYDEFTKAGEFSDAAAQAQACVDKLRAMGDALLEAGDYDGARSAYKLLPDDAEAAALTQYTGARRREAAAAEDPADYSEAAALYEAIPDVRDSAQRAAACRESLFQLAETAYAEGRYSDAAALYGHQLLYREGADRSAYASAMALEKAAASEPVQYAAAAEAFEALGDYSDSAQRAAACRETLFQLAETALAEGRYADAAAYYSSQPAYNTADKQVAYVSALAMQAEGEASPVAYLEAAAAFDALGEFRDAAERAAACRDAYYAGALALAEAEDFAAASKRLALLGDYGDAPTLLDYCSARICLNEGDHAQALTMLAALGDYRDAAAQLASLKAQVYALAVEDFDAGRYAAAAERLRLLGDHEDAAPFAAYAEGLVAEAAWLAGDAAQLDAAKAAFAEAGDFRDAAAHLGSVTAYAEGLALLEAGRLDEAKVAFGKAGGYQQADELAAYGLARVNEARGDAGDTTGYILAADQYEAMGDYADAPQRATRLRNKLNILFADHVRPEKEGLRAVQRNGKWGFANAQDELVSDFQWDDCHDFAEDHAAVKKDGKWGFIRKDGSVLQTPIYDTVYDFSEGRARVVYSDSYRYLMATGSLLSADGRSGFNNATDFHQGRAMVWESGWNDGWSIIDLNGKVLVDERISYNGSSWYIKESGTFSNGFARIGIARYSYYSADEYVYVNLDGEYVSDVEPVAVGKYWKIGYYDNDAYMNQQGTIVTKAAALNFNGEGYCLTAVNGKKGMIRLDGTTVTDNRWDDIHHFSGDRALVRSGNYYGFIDRSGTEVIKCQYNDAHDFSCGLALVKLNGMCGFINEAGEIVVPLIYDDATDFADGKATVQRYGQWTAIGADGKPVE